MSLGPFFQKGAFMAQGALRPQVAAVIVSLGLLASCFHKKYDAPITKNTQQPDKVLFDQAVKDIEHGRYEVARISLQTLMNTYESSEYMAKAKLAVADSWYREGGANGLAQAEAEYKDFKLFYPNMEESPQAQNRICEIHYKQMEKSDRDWSQTLRAEEECRQLLIEYPNSKFAPQTAQLVRNIQESLAAHEFVVGDFYWRREMNPAAANRLGALVDQYPLFSHSGEALYEAGDSYSKMGPRFRKQSGEMFGRVVREYPLSSRAEAARKRLEEMELPVPAADPAAMQRAKFEVANYKRPGMVSRSTSWLKSTPDLSHAAKSGAPTMTGPKATLPASVPVVSNTDVANGTGAGTGTGLEVSATPVGGSSALDKNPDARAGAAANTDAGSPTAGTTPAPTATNNQAAADQSALPLPTNRDKELKELRARQAKAQAKLDKKRRKGTPTASQQQQGQSQLNQSSATQGAQSTPGVPNASTPAATNATQHPTSPTTAPVATPPVTPPPQQ